MSEIAALLDAHGLTGVREELLQHTGFSGANITRLRRDDGASFVLKRMSIERDWIMRATDDVHCREAAFAEARKRLPSILTPNIGAARDGDEYTLLMHDISDDLLPQGVISDDIAGQVIARIAALHDSVHVPDGVPWCDLGKRLTLLTPDTARIAARYGARVADDVTRGWALFERYASPAAVEIVHRLFADVTPLLRAIEDNVYVMLHGDLKFDNIGLDTDGRLCLFDWSMTLLAPPAVDLGWFMAINSRRMTISLDDVLTGYAHAAGVTYDARPRHDALTVLCGLLLRGWRKALDAEEGEPDELRWWCARAEEAARWL